ncbi:MAG: DNA-directed RNA polymerase subunit RpoH/Rpb5 C-terminal domain-containing protein [Candidatus Micrarchaeota archaeon]
MVKKKNSVELDILSHSLVPQMNVLSEKQKEEMLKHYNINDTQLPRILSTDPVVAVLNAKTGDIIHIKRKDVTASYDSYRVVISK